MARNFKRNQVKASILGYYYYIRGVEKSGKTTLFYDLIDKVFNGDLSKGLLISMGKEDGYKALPDIQYEVINDTMDSKGKVVKTGWKDFEDLVTDLVEGRKENGIELIGIDTYDEFCELAKNEVIRLHNIENPTKKVKSINAAFGGFSGGFDKFAEIVEGQLHRLRKAGFTVFIISHTKVRTIKEKGMADDESYSMLTTNLDSRFDNVISHKADVIATIQIEKNIQNGRLNGTDRYIYFRESNFVKAGTRFKGIVEKVELSAENFIKAIEEGIKASLRTDISDKDFEVKKIKDEEERQATIDQNIDELKEADLLSVDVDRNIAIKDIVTSKWKDVSKEVKEEIKEIMSNNGIAKISDVESNPTTIMEQILSIIE